MSKLGGKSLVPVLRFAEFRDAGEEWEEKKLGDLSQILRGGSPRPIDEYITSDVNGLNWLKIADVDKEAKYVTYTKEKVLVTALSKTREVNPGDLIMSNSMSFGRPYILKIKSCIHDGWIAVTQIDEQVRRDYLYYLILSPTSQEYFVNNAAGSGVQNLNADIIKLLPVLIPTYTEQQKIADCLTSIDELIAAETQKLDALKTHKKGLMQQLLPAEGETVPKRRFPEFLDKGEWEKARLGDKDISTFIKDRIPLEKIDIESYISTVNLLPDYAGAKSATTLPPSGSFTQFRINDILISNIRPYLRKVWQAHMDGSASNDVIVIRAKNKIIDNFLIYILKNDDFINYVMKDAKGVKMPRGDISSMKKYPLYCPSKNEQQKIADCLTSIDELITNQTKKVESLKAHKKGLMQQLFPVMDKVGA